MRIETIDRNFQPATVENIDVEYRSALRDPFRLEGFPWQDPGHVFNRLPANLTEREVNSGALFGAKLTAGGAIRFRTDSPCMALRARLKHPADMNHMPRAASAGFDLYRGSGPSIRYYATVQPDSGQHDLERLPVRSHPGPSGMRDWTLYLPLYGSADTIEIGLAPGAAVEPPTGHTVQNPILFYGSSITQGGCASRPGNAYTTMLCRELDAPQINLGFSGCGRGEPAIAEAISGLNLSAFVLDYDHNAPDLEHLTRTHEPFFRIVRDAQPDLPVVVLSQCDFHGHPWERERRDVIRATVDRAIRDGDTRVWFVDGESLFGTEHRDACTVDGCHPNDLGFYRMFQTVLPVLRNALQPIPRP